MLCNSISELIYILGYVLFSDISPIMSSPISKVNQPPTDQEIPGGGSESVTSKSKMFKGRDIMENLTMSFKTCSMSSTWIILLKVTILHL